MDVTSANEAAWVLASYLIQVALLWWGMIRVTAPGVPENSFRKIMALWLGTLPLIGWLVARRWQGVVRAHVMRIQLVCLAMWAAEIVVAAVLER